MIKKIAWSLISLGLIIFGLIIYLHLFQNIETGDILISFILCFMFAFSGLSFLSIAQNHARKIIIRKYFLIILILLLSVAAVGYIFQLRAIFQWFYIIAVLFFAFGLAPLNGSIRINKWTKYVDSKITVKILGSADHLGILLFVIGLTWKSMHWPLANELLIMGIILLIFAAITWNQVFRKQLVLRKIAEDQLREKNQEIMDSIIYAKRIQSAILPPNKLVKEFLKQSFILYKPKDIVAGDFYWMENIDGKVLFAAADCTGHGVPGAMVSVVCNNGLNRSVREYGLTNPGNILDKTREIVIQEFEKSEEEVKDGMDIALCSLEGDKLEYAGAHNPLWIIRNGEVLETKANKTTYRQI